MLLLVGSLLLASAFARPDGGYRPPTPGGPGVGGHVGGGGGHVSVLGGGFEGALEGGLGVGLGGGHEGVGELGEAGEFGGAGGLDAVGGAHAAAGPVACSNGQVLRADGVCVTPVVKRHIFVFGPQPREIPVTPPPVIPDPVVVRNVIIVKSPDTPTVRPPVVVPPPQHLTKLYVLSKRPEGLGPELIEVSAPPAPSPEVFYINYGEGENPQLPHGIDLQTTLGAAGGAGGAEVAGGLGGVEDFENGLGGGAAGFGAVGGLTGAADSIFGGTGGHGGVAGGLGSEFVGVSDFVEPTESLSARYGGTGAAGSSGGGLPDLQVTQPSLDFSLSEAGGPGVAASGDVGGHGIPPPPPPSSQYGSPL